MSLKRDLDEDEDGEIPEPETKRAKTPNRQHRHERPRHTADPAWGQKYVFGGSENSSTIPLGEESEFEDDTDAMTYLMSVRQEAGAIPHTLVAPKPTIGPQLPAGLQAKEDDQSSSDGELHSDEDYADYEAYSEEQNDGYYEDGAYVGLPQGSNQDGIEGGAADGLAGAYFDSIMNQYILLRSTIWREPPADATVRLPSPRFTYVAPFSRKPSTMRMWSRILRESDPHPLQISLMTKESVLRLLRVILDGEFLRRSSPVTERTSRWVWALLARLPEKGDLDYTEVGGIRDLGRRAVLLSRTMEEIAALQEELDQGGTDVEDEGLDTGAGDEVIAIPGMAKPVDLQLEKDKHRTDPEEGEVDENEAVESEAGDTAMDMSSSTGADEDEGEDQGKLIVDTGEADLEGAKCRLLARLEAPVSDKELAAQAARDRASMNTRATLNMILTVAGEFYGQLDLLEFREPFGEL